MQDGEKSPKTKVRSGFGLDCGLDLASERAAGMAWSLALCILFFSCGAYTALREGGEKRDILIHVTDSVLGMPWKIVDARSNASFAPSTDLISMRYARRCEGSAMANPLLKTSRSNMSRVCLGVRT